jgi:hypothetical protein
MTDSRIIFYEGRKGNETPRRLVRDNKSYEIDIKKQERRMDEGTGNITDVFFCKAGPYSLQVLVHPDGTYSIHYLIPGTNQES